MRNLIRFFIRNHVLLLFVALEIFSMVLIFNYNNFQRVQYLNSSNKVTASVYNSFNKVVNYFRLITINEELAEENARLKSELSNVDGLTPITQEEALPDSVVLGKFRFKSAMVINNSVNKQYNYFTLNKGRRQGVLADQGVVSEKGIIGIISHVSESYATGLSMLNRRLMISGKLKKDNSFGSVSWNGLDFRYVQLSDIPSHVEVAVGDSVVTRGSSTYFPEGILIGTVESVEVKPGESFYTIRVKLAVDFKSVTYVEIVENRDKEEIEELENVTQDDQGMD